MLRKAIVLLTVAVAATLTGGIATAASQPGAEEEAAPHCTGPWTAYRTREGRAMAVAAAGGSGTRVIAWNYLRTNEQEWCIEGTTSNFSLHPRHAPGLCLDVPGGNYTAGTNLIVWTCNGRGNQKFRLVNNTTTNYFNVETNGHSNRCLDTHTADNGEPVQIWTCDDSPREDWTISSA
jgi:hypothetical protein